MIHLTALEKYPGNMTELAEEIGNLRYDALSDFLNLLADKIEKDGRKDGSRGRVQLASRLEACAGSIRASITPMDEAWKICRPYMKS